MKFIERTTLFIFSDIMLILSIIACVLIFGLLVSLCIPSWRSALSFWPIFNQALIYTQPEILHVGQIWFLMAMFMSSIIYYIIEN